MMNRREAMKSLAIAAVTVSVAAPIVGCSTSWIATALNDLPTAVDIATSILGIVTVATGNGVLDIGISAMITTAAGLVKTGLVTLQALIADYQATPNNLTILSKINAALTDLKTNLSSILQIAGIKDQALQIAIATAVGLAIATVSAIQTLVPPSAASTTLHKAAKANLLQPTIVPDKGQLVSLYNATLVMHGYKDFQIKGK